MSATREITLSDGSLVVVDEVDYEWARAQRWNCSNAAGGRKGYAARGTSAGGKRRTWYMHREIGVRAGIIDSYDDVRHIDHIDIDSRNNSRSNLRAVTVSQNNANVHPRTKSGLTGVYEYRPGQWCFEVQRKGRPRVRRYGFESPDSAHAARQAAL